jgi:rubredoxin
MTAETTDAQAEEEQNADETESGEEQQAASDDEESEGRLGEEIDAEERFGDDETVSDSATCPECGEPVHNLRMTCPMCGHEYKDKEYDDDEAGTEFRAGSEVDEDEIGEKVKESQSASASPEGDDGAEGGGDAGD